MNITIYAPMEIDGNLIEVDFTNPDGHAVTLTKGAIRWPKLDGVPMTEVPAWLTAAAGAHIHLGEQPAAPKTIGVRFPSFDDPLDKESDHHKLWAFWLAWAEANSGGTAAKFKVDYAADDAMKELLFYSGAIGARILKYAIERIPSVTNFPSFLQWTRDNLDATDIGDIF